MIARAGRLLLWLGTMPGNAGLFSAVFGRPAYPHDPHQLGLLGWE